VALGHDGPLLHAAAANCRSSIVHDGIDKLAERVTTAVAHRTEAHPSGLEKIFDAIKKDAPNAHVFVIGYPTIVPDPSNTPAGGCFAARLSGANLTDSPAVNVFPFTDIDTIYLHSIQQKLDETTRRAARHAGFSYISMLGRTAAHSACAPSSERFLNGVSVDRNPSGSVLLRAESLHPDTLGKSFLAAIVSPVIAASIRVNANPHPNASPPQWMPLWIIPAGVLGVSVGLILLLRLRSRRRGGSAG
jgi:hypothetical protein